MLVFLHGVSAGLQRMSFFLHALDLPVSGLVGKGRTVVAELAGFRRVRVAKPGRKGGGCSPAGTFGIKIGTHAVFAPAMH